MSQRGESPLRELCRGVMPAPDPEHEHARRERIAGRVLELQRQLGRQRQTRRRAAFASALAALLGGALVLVLWLRAPVEPPDAGVRLLSGHASSGEHGELALLPGPLAPGDALLVTPESDGAELLLSSETALAVAPASRVGLERRTRAGKFEERVRLVQGRVALRVPKLGPRGKVSVETGDALVEVHGTRFSVRVVPRVALPAFTEVAVEEGRVRVRGPAGERMLGAGERWSSAAPGSSVAESQAAAPAPLVAEQTAAEQAKPERAAPRATRQRTVARPTPTPPTPTPPTPTPPTPSELAAQNRLVEAAELARKNGLPQLALERLGELIRRYPASEHAHSARVTRFRLLRQLNRDEEARAAARQYLELHPRGFARAEVEEWLQAP